MKFKFALLIKTRPINDIIDLLFSHQIRRLEHSYPQYFFLYEMFTKLLDPLESDLCTSPTIRTQTTTSKMYARGRSSK